MAFTLLRMAGLQQLRARRLEGRLEAVFALA